MPKIGKPQEPSLYSDIKMKRIKDMTNNSDKSIGEQLNSVAGRRRQNKYVDAKQHNKMGKDGFLRLLTHQLSNQDPFKPVDQKEFAADLAQFSQLEQLTNMNKKMDKQVDNAPTESKFYGASFLGKEVLTQGTSLDYSGQGETVQLPFQLERDAKTVFVRIYDSREQLIAQLEKENMSQGSQTISWDGTSRDGTIASKDKYRFEVIAYDNTFEEFHGKTSATGIVTGVEFAENGETVLMVDGDKKIFLRDVQSFRLPKEVKNMPANKPSMQQAQKQFEKNMVEY